MPVAKREFIEGKAVYKCPSCDGVVPTSAFRDDCETDNDQVGGICPNVNCGGKVTLYETTS